MKRNFMKKAVAVSLSAAMAFSLSAANALTASAASTVSMAKKATVTVGKTKKLTVKTNKKWKIKSVGGSEAKKYLTIKKASNTKVSLKGKKATKASKPVTVRVRVKKTSGKKTEKVLKCKVTVKKASTPNVTPEPTPTPDVTPTPTPTPEVQTSADVKNQAELDAALADSNITKINIVTSDEVSFVIPEGPHDNVDLTVNAAAASVTNNAKFKSITVEAISDHTWTENGQDNTITVTAPVFHFVVGKTAKGTSLRVTKKSTVTVDGDASSNIVNVTVEAEGSILTSTAPVAITALAEVSVTLEASATGSTFKVVRGQKPFAISLINKTNNDIVVKDDKDATVVTARKNTNTPATGTTQVADTTPTPTPTPTPGQSGTTTKKDLTDAFLAKPSITTPPSSTTTSSSAIDFTFNFGTPKVYKMTVSGSAIKSYDELSGVDIEYSATVRNETYTDGEKIVYGGQLGSRKADAGKDMVFTLNAPETDTSSITYHVDIYAVVKENSTYKQGANTQVGSYKVVVTRSGSDVSATSQSEKDYFSTFKDDKDKEISAVKIEVMH